MYSFEYNGTRSKGIHFLRGLPIVSEQPGSSNPEVVAHGDELGYMFDTNDLFGNPIAEAKLVDEEDLKVRKNLIGMLVTFAKSFGTENQKNPGSDSLFRSVTGKGVPFIKVNTELSADSDFRFCELSVLGASLTPLTSTTCQSLSGLLTPLTGVVGGTLDGVGDVLGGGRNTFGGVLGGGGGRPSGGRRPGGQSNGGGGVLGAGGLLG